MLDCENLQIQFALLASFKRSETVRKGGPSSECGSKPKPKLKQATTVDSASSPSTTKYFNNARWGKIMKAIIKV